MKAVYLLRHGQSEYNAAPSDPFIWDAPLTEKGHNQARSAIPHVQKIPSILAFCAPDNAEIDVIIVSPLHRALQTMTHATSTLPKSIPVIVVRDIAERVSGKQRQ